MLFKLSLLFMLSNYNLTVLLNIIMLHVKVFIKDLGGGGGREFPEYEI